MITKKQFDVLVYLSEKHKPLSQHEIARDTKMSVGTVNKCIAELTNMGYINDGVITSAGIDALEPYRVKRAVFIAAGFGSRMAPVTLYTPKPLIPVNGKRIITTLLDAVVAAGIPEIYIVRGYLSEQFDQLLNDYPMIKFIENPYYNEANNISSVACAGYLLKNAYILEADLFLYNPKLITKYQYHSNYLAVPVEKTDDWCFETNDSGVIEKLLVGGVNCHHMFGISYWDEQDGARLVNHINQVYQSPGGKDKYWDQIALEFFRDEYKIHVRECSFDDIIEIDTYNELKQLDKTYDV
ncbi:MAG: winged helix-turn-helix transcriptional regulator [Ruminococcaceae bacterium]|nr:winged helix-turn-helix transcriptional regulator [Oscillospiraceae bacterium]